MVGDPERLLMTSNFFFTEVLYCGVGWLTQPDDEKDLSRDT